MLYVSVPLHLAQGLSLKMTTGILQGDADDWKEAASTMASIYEHAFVTIAAAASNDSDEGLFRDNGLRHWKLDNTPLHVSRCRLRDFPYKGQNISSEAGTERKFWPLLDRAWVFQERLMSPRIIHFTRYQIIWECRSTLMSETQMADFDEDWTAVNYQKGVNKQPHKFPREDTIATWHHSVNHHNSLDLTYEEDRLPAIAALVERMTRIRGGDMYIAGIWVSSLLQDLAWVASPSTLKSTYSLPSWTWASCPKSRYIYSADNMSCLPIARVLYHSFVGDGPAHLGKVQNAQTRLQGSTLCALITTRGGVWTIDPATNKHPEVDLPAAGWFRIDYNLEDGPAHVTPCLPAHVLFLWHTCEPFDGSDHSWHGLVLQEISDGKHKRGGIYKLSHYHSSNPAGGWEDNDGQVSSDYLDSLPIQALTIV